jgi:predicted acyl esterase
MAKVSAALQHPFLMAIIPAAIGLGGTMYLSDKNKGVDEAEKIYWASIQPPNDSEEKYCAYLKKYPQGNFVDIAETECPAAIEAKEQAEEKAKELAEKAAEVAEQQAEVEAVLREEEREAMTAQ